MKKVSILKNNLMRAAMTLALIVTCATAWAQNPEVSYIAADGSTQTCTDYTVLHTGDNVSNLPGGWYVVSENAEFSSKMNFSGSASIILCDGKTLTVNSGDYSGILGKNFTVYGQSGQSGTLNASANNIGINVDDLTINGGIVSGNGEGLNGISGSSIIINRGTVTGTGSSLGISSSSNFTFNGGKVTATGGSYGIYAANKITLGWTNYTDFINANSYFATVNNVAIATGKTLYDGTTGYSGPLDYYQIQALGGKTLRPYSSNDFSVNDAGTEYTIHNATGWNVFCDALLDKDTYNGFSGKTVYLANDIEVSRMAGSAYHDFAGTFDGQGNGQNNTLTFNYTTTESTEHVAPFSYITNNAPVGSTTLSPAVIRNLNVVANITTGGQIAGGIVGESWGELTIEHCTVSGTITTSNQFAGGIIGRVSSTPLNITDCRSSVTINSSVSGDGTHGGIAARVSSSSSVALNISGCLFNGKIVSTTGTTHCGGFVGHNDHSNGANVSISNSLYAPTADANTVSAGCATFIRDAATITNCYYTTTLGTPQGKQTRSITAGDYFTSVANAGTPTSYNTSGITSYGTGIKYNNVLYAGENDQVNLTLNHSEAPTGYTFNGYAASAGTLSGTTLTMPNEDVTISATMTANTYYVQFDGNGATEGSMSNQPFTYDVAQNLTANAFTLTGYHFNGWNTQANGGGTSYTDGQEVINLTDQGTVTLYAQWTLAVVPVTYLDMNGTQQQCTNYTVLTGGGATTLAAGWYVVNSDISYTGTVTLGGNVNLILCDGYTMNIGTIENRIDGSGISNLSGATLTITSQSLGSDMGTLSVYSKGVSNNAIVTGAITINGGNITADIRGEGSNALYSNGADVTINGGTLSATAAGSEATAIAAIMNFNYTGGNVTATANGSAISANNKRYTFTWRNPSDQIVIASTGLYAPDDTYTATFTKAFTDGTNIYSGILTGSELNVLAGKTLYPYIEGSVAYLDMNGQRQLRLEGQYTTLTNSMTTLGTAGQETWYVAESTINFDQHISTAGDVHIILKDEAVMNVGTAQNPIQGYGIGDYNANSSISIYGQSTGTNNGQLNVYATSTAIWAFSGNFNCSNARVTASSSNDISIWAFNGSVTGKGNLTLKDATINATGYYGLEAQGGNVEINGGQVTATGNDYGIYAYGGSVNINGGKVTATSSNGSGICSVHSSYSSSSGFVNISGGQVTATGNSKGIYTDNGGVTISGGELTATGNSRGIEAYSGSVTISGGQVTATGDKGIYTQRGSVTINGGQVSAIGNYDGIYVYQSGDLILGWTNTSDFIYANSYGAAGTISIAEGKAFIDENGDTYASGTVSASAINGKTLYPYIEGSVAYLDMNGQRQLCTEYIPLTDNETDPLTTGWYVAEGTINFTNNILVNGDIHIILKDNAVMNVGTAQSPVSTGIEGIYQHLSNINIYGQSTGENNGQLNIYATYVDIRASGGDFNCSSARVTASSSNDISILATSSSGTGGNITLKDATVNVSGPIGILAIGNLTINGGEVTASASSDVGIKANGGSVTINGGKVTATATSSNAVGIEADNGSVNINGGQVTATGNGGSGVGIMAYGSGSSVNINGGQVTASGYYGIYAPNGNINLGWTNATDYILANSYNTNGTLTLTKTFIDENGNPYSGAIAQENGAYAIDGKKLYPYIPGAISYLDENGQQVYCAEYTTLTGNETNLAAGWYVADGTLNFDQHISTAGDVHIILKDDAVMNVGTAGSPVNQYGIKVANGYSLGIYAQSTGATKGQLNVYATQYGIDAENGASVNINGGSMNINGGLTATGYTLTYGIYAYQYATVNINGGEVTATGIGNYPYGIYAYRYATVNINGGEVTATGNGDGGSGIFAEKSTMTISGGQVTATGGIGIYVTANDASLTINGGEVTATGDRSIYAQNGSSVTINGGEVTASGEVDGIYAYNGSDITISSGQVSATGRNHDGIFAYQSTMTISGGQVTANGNDSGIYFQQNTMNISGGQVTAIGTLGIEVHGASVNISGGQVTADGTSYGIYASNGSVTLGWTNYSGFILASSYGIDSYYESSSISIAEGKAFIAEDGSIYQSGPLTDYFEAIAGKKLYPYVEGSIPYLDENGQRQLCTNYTLLTSNMYNLGTYGQETWYVADGNVTFSNTIYVANGNVHIILKDNAVMNVGTEQGYIDDKGIYVSNSKSLSIYAQSTGADKGQLNVYATSNGFYALNSGASVNINGGQVTATGGGKGIYANLYATVNINGGQVTANGNNGNGLRASQNSTLTISGGQVTATGNGNYYSYGIMSDNSTVTISGGQVTATGNGNYSNGIMSDNSTLTISGGQVTANGTTGISAYNPYNGTFTLGWTNPTDFIYANSYNAYGNPINIAEGKAFITDNGATYTSGALTSEELAAIAGKTLYPQGVIFKEVTGYGEGSGGWVFIASPVKGSIAPTNVHNLVATPAEDFDLYYFDQTREKEWVNYKDNESHTNVDPGFNLVSGKGYLYATKYTKKLAFGGTFITSNEPVAVPLPYETTNPNQNMWGWNLVGNPFTVEATMTDGLGQPKSYYVISGQTVVPYEGTATTIEPFTGVMVKAEGTGESVYFTKVSSNAAPQPNNGSLHIALSQVVEPVETPARDGNGLKVGPSTGSGTLALDNAIVSFNEGSQLGKFYFGEQNANLYLPQGAEEYAIVSVGNAGEMPVNFKAKENGTYTIAVNPKGVEMIYLHLIDNLTGADVDLLQTPEYTFTAKTTDYASRFKLMFSINQEDGPSTGSGTFAFISNGNLIVNGEGMLQIMDVTGRMIRCTDVARNVSTSGMVPGVYVLRLINGDNVKTQKIVVR